MALARKGKVWAAAGLMAALIASGAMARGMPDHPVRMSGLHVSGLAGYPVFDRAGERVGEIIAVEAAPNGQTRWLNIALDAGGEVRVASFRADLDPRQKLINLRLAEDILIARALENAQAASEVSSPSA